jgi:hypothetical protein
MRAATVARFADLLLPGLYAWAVTVAWPVLARPSVASARTLVLVSVTALLSGSAVSIRRPVPGRLLGVWFFLALCGGVWVSARFQARAPSLDPVQAIAGAFGWALFALGWAGDGAAPAARSVTSGNVAGSLPFPGGSSELRRRRYSPRSQAWPAAAWLVAFAIGAAAILLALAFWVPGRARALFAHATAIAGAVALVGAAAEIASRHRSAGPTGEARAASGFEHAPWRARLAEAKTTLILLAALSLAGAILAWMR